MKVLLWKSERIPAAISFPQDYKQVIENLGYIHGVTQKDLLETYHILSFGKTGIKAMWETRHRP